jgi:putative tryptophan/tyrosine transport system substrate-binding protein
MKWREFITLLGGAAAASSLIWPLAARAQPAVVPVIGYLSIGSSESDAARLIGLREGLSEIGYVEGRDLAIDYRWAQNQSERLPMLAAHLVQAQVSAIITPGLTPTLAAKAATTTIPILFAVGTDPVQVGLVASLNRPGGNLTGVNQFNSELGAKGLSLLHELVPNATTIAFLENPNNPIDQLIERDVREAARVIGLQIQTLKASNVREIDAAFESLQQTRTDALLVGNDVFLNGQIELIIALAKRYAVPTMHSSREFALAGGLMSYGASLADTYRQVGLYAGRILKGMKPADLPVIQSTKLGLIINLKTAKTLGLAIPPGVLTIADEVLE